MKRRKRARRRPELALSFDELVAFLGGDRALAHKVLRALRIPVFSKERPRAQVRRVERWLQRRARET